ncbi:MAG: exonuclease SbcCD subunit D C-terminal domain-containing protein [Bernardetiaceae bacterium]|nr:exonuclease SbcCD subunit D C-terminal domain-containing protein [Bernardetiaceae bacterium]
MKIIHTADWHLGQRFINRTREEEHAAFLAWLLQTIKDENVDILIIAGDVFDSGNPPNYALKQYYNFIADLQQTPCRHLLVIGGNHDSVLLLESAKEALSHLNTHIVGGASEDYKDDIFELKDAQGNIELAVCAVPFLRDKDLHYSYGGEGVSQREQLIREGISKHYQKMATAATEYKKAHIPVITTGHLFTQNASVSDPEAAKDTAERNIYLGNLGHFDPKDFPSVFDYVALGHIHQAQLVDKNNPFVRYAGSPIPLSFTERNTKTVYMLEYKANKLEAENIKAIKIPLYRPLVRIEGSLDELKEKLRKLELPQAEAIAWAEVRVRTQTHDSQVTDVLNEFVKKEKIPIEILKTPLVVPLQDKADALLDESFSLKDDDSPLKVFEKKCEREGIQGKEKQQYVQTFHELREWLLEKEAQ